MIVLDTNVVSELMKEAPEPAIGSWFRSLSGETVSVTAVSVAELWYGLLRMPDGRKRRALFDQFEALAGPSSGIPVLMLTESAARTAARFRVVRELAGLHGAGNDMLIAGIVDDWGASFATRNVKDFRGLPIEIVNPWNPPGKG